MRNGSPACPVNTTNDRPSVRSIGEFGMKFVLFCLLVLMTVVIRNGYRTPLVWVTFFLAAIAALVAD